MDQVSERVPRSVLSFRVRPHMLSELPAGPFAKRKALTSMPFPTHLALIVYGPTVAIGVGEGLPEAAEVQTSFLVFPVRLDSLMSAPARALSTTSEPLTAFAATSAACTWAPGPMSSVWTVFEPVKATAVPPLTATNKAMAEATLAKLRCCR